MILSSFECCIAFASGSPDVHASPTKPTRLDDHGFGTVATRSSGRGNSTATSTDNHIVKLFRDGRHCGSGDGKVTGDVRCSECSRFALRYEDPRWNESPQFGDDGLRV